MADMETLTEQDRYHVNAAKKWLDENRGAPFAYVLGNALDIIDRLTTPSSPAAPIDETGWLIEHGGSKSPVYWIGRNRWDGDHLKAVRFCREKDAFKVALSIENYGPPHRVFEHSWSSEQHTRVPAAPDAGEDVEVAEIDRWWYSQVAEESEFEASAELKKRRFEKALEYIETLLRKLRASDGELAKIRGVQFSPTGDNHHNALLCPYCNPNKFELRAPAAPLVAAALAPFAIWAHDQLERKLPKNIADDPTTPVIGDIFRGEPDITVWNLRCAVEALPVSEALKIVKSYRQKEK